MKFIIYSSLPDNTTYIMKSLIRLSILSSLLFIGLITNAQSATKTAPAAAVQGPHMTFTKELIDIGKVKRGEKKTFKFEFVNTGTEPLDFEIVSGCDCTTLDWPRKKVKVGEKAYLDVIFDSTEKEESETVDVDIYLKNINPKTKKPFFKIVKYKFELIEK